MKALRWMRALASIACAVTLLFACRGTKDAGRGVWSYISVPESRCANGTPTGFAVNSPEDPEGLLVFMRGGGACWNAKTCIDDATAVHLREDVGKQTVLAEARELGGLFDRTGKRNPFAGYAYIAMSYCTGDLYTGTRTQEYESASKRVSIMHHGARNLELFLPLIANRFRDLRRVVVYGGSAGGYGAALNWWRYQAAFPDARVDVLSDAAPLVDAKDARYADMVAAWGMPVPASCTDCATRISAWMAYNARRLPPPHRYALVSTLGDDVVSTFLGLNAMELAARLLVMRKNTASHQKTWFMRGRQHGVMRRGAISDEGGASLVDWITAFANDDADWDHKGP